MIDFSKINGNCIRCRACSKKQELEGMPKIMIGHLASLMDQATCSADIADQTYEFIRSCNLCNACTSRCPSDISCADVVRAARQKLLQFEPQIADEYRYFRVDYQENLFASLRKINAINYPEILETVSVETVGIESDQRGAAPDVPATESISLFMPGCTLGSYSQSLTMAVFDLLLSRGAVQGMTSLCCGNPLQSFGDNSSYDAYTQNFIQLLRRNRVSRIVFACPNCMYSTETALINRGITDIEIVALPELLVNLGIRYFGPSNTEDYGVMDIPWDSFSSICVHDSCPDRFTQRFGRAVRQLFDVPGLTVQEMSKHGRDTICCGSGGLVAVSDSGAAHHRRQLRLEQFRATGADCLVCYCVSCVNMFIASRPRPQVRHYLELICKVQLDWENVGAAMSQLQRDDSSPLLKPLDQATPVFDE